MAFKNYRINKEENETDTTKKKTPKLYFFSDWKEIR